MIIGAPDLGSAEGGHPDLFRVPRFLPICSNLRSLFSGFVPLCSELPICSDLLRFLQIVSEQIRANPFLKCAAVEREKVASAAFRCLFGPYGKLRDFLGIGGYGVSQQSR